MTEHELLALVRWTNALGNTLEVNEPLGVEQLGMDGAQVAGVLESAGLVELRDVNECPRCGGWDGEHPEEHEPVAARRRRVLTGNAVALTRWLLATIAGLSITVEADAEPVVLSHAIETRVRLAGHDLRLRVAIGRGEPPFAIAPGERFLRLRLGSAPALDDQSRVVDVDAAALLRDSDTLRRVLAALDRLELLSPHPILPLEDDLAERDRHLILESACDFLRARGYTCSDDPNLWSRLFQDMGAEAGRGVFGCRLESRDVLLVLCRCPHLPDRLHIHAFVASRPRPAFEAEPALRQLLSGLHELYLQRLTLRHRWDGLKELGERIQGLAGVAAVMVTAGLYALGLTTKPEALAPALAGLILLRSYVRYGLDLLRLWRWDWQVE